MRLEQALPFRRCVGGEDVLWGSPASQTPQKPQVQYHGEARSSGVVPRRVPSLSEECALMDPLQGASFLSTPLQGGILKPPALRVVGDWTGKDSGGICRTAGRGWVEVPAGVVPGVQAAGSGRGREGRESGLMGERCRKIRMSLR